MNCIESDAKHNAPVASTAAAKPAAAAKTAAAKTAAATNTTTTTRRRNVALQHFEQLSGRARHARARACGRAARLHESQSGGRERSDLAHFQGAWRDVCGEPALHLGQVVPRRVGVRRHANGHDGERAQLLVPLAQEVSVGLPVAPAAAALPLCR